MPASQMRRQSCVAKKSTQEETQQGIRAACVPDLSDKLKYVRLLQQLWQARIRGLHGIIKVGIQAKRVSGVEV